MQLHVHITYNSSSLIVSRQTEVTGVSLTICIPASLSEAVGANFSLIGVTFHSEQVVLSFTHCPNFPTAGQARIVCLTHKSAMLIGDVCAEQAAANGS